MLDNSVCRLIDPALERVAGSLAGAGVTADGLTIAGFAFGVAAAALLASQRYGLAALAILASRACDGLDGAVARHTIGPTGTDRGGYLDIVLDFAFYGLVPLGFVLADPAANGVAGAVLLTAFYSNGASFLAYALMAEKRGEAEGRGPKAFLYTVGLAEGTETIAVFLAMCLLPGWFPVLAYAFAALTVVTTLARLAMAWTTFRD